MPSLRAANSTKSSQNRSGISLDLLRERSVNVALEEIMPGSIGARLAGLPELSRAELCDLWKELFNASPDPKLRRDLMIPILAYRMQEETFGSLNANTK